jgi:hypothetical protein
MTARIRKLVGGAALMIFLGAYIWGASTLSDHLPDSGAIRLGFYAIVGMAWGLPILPLISWMNRGR